jgi:hypothetical protein
VSKHFITRNVEMSKCTPFGVGFRYRELECRNTSSQGMSECRNAEMRKTPFGVGFGYRELECRNTSSQGMSQKHLLECFGIGVSKHFTTRNAEMRKKTPFGVGFGYQSWSVETLHQGMCKSSISVIATWSVETLHKMRNVKL